MEDVSRRLCLSKDVETIARMSRIGHRILESDDAKYRSLRQENKVVRAILSDAGGRELFAWMGFRSREGMLRFEGDNDHLQHVLEWLDNFERGAEVELVVRLPRGGSAISAGFSRSETVADVLAYLNKFAPIERVGLPGSRFLEHSTTLDFLAPRAVLVSESSLERKPPPEKKTVDIKRRENHRNERKEALKEREATLKNFYADHQR